MEFEEPKYHPHKPPESCEACKSSRRDILLGIGAALNVVAGAMISLPILGYVLSSFVRKMPLEWISLGPVEKFPDGSTRIAHYKNPYSNSWDGSTADIPCWVRHIKDNDFQVFAINCTHLGCPVRWFEQSKLFLCPCHGGAFYQDGEHASGPPPRGLYTYEVKVENNELLIKGGVLPTLASSKV